jgi:hypothetical protein
MPGVAASFLQVTEPAYIDAPAMAPTTIGAKSLDRSIMAWRNFRNRAGQTIPATRSAANSVRLTLR